MIEAMVGEGKIGVEEVEAAGIAVAGVVSRTLIHGIYVYAFSARCIGGVGAFMYHSIQKG